MGDLVSDVKSSIPTRSEDRETEQEGGDAFSSRMQLRKKRKDQSDSSSRRASKKPVVENISSTRPPTSLAPKAAPTQKSKGKEKMQGHSIPAKPTTPSTEKLMGASMKALAKEVVRQGGTSSNDNDSMQRLLDKPSHSPSAKTKDITIQRISSTSGTPEGTKEEVEDEENENVAPAVTSTLAKINQIPGKTRLKFLKFLQQTRSCHYANRIIYGPVHLNFRPGPHSPRITAYNLSTSFPKNPPIVGIEDDKPTIHESLADSFEIAVRIPNSGIEGNTTSREPPVEVHEGEENGYQSNVEPEPMVEDVVIKNVPHNSPHLSDEDKLFDSDEDELHILEQLLETNPSMQGDALEPSVNQPELDPKYVKLWDHFRSTYLREDLNLRTLLAIPDINKTLEKLITEFDQFESIIPESDRETLGTFIAIFDGGHNALKIYMNNQMALNKIEAETKWELSRVQEKLKATTALKTRNSELKNSISTLEKEEEDLDAQLKNLQTRIANVRKRKQEAETERKALLEDRKKSKASDSSLLTSVKAQLEKKKTLEVDKANAEKELTTFDKKFNRLLASL